VASSDEPTSDTSRGVEHAEQLFQRASTPAGLPAAGGPARLLLLGGAPFGEPLILCWSLGGRTNDEIAQAQAD
jgi:redox-sensitive bicupin YhaK (pirin superfamily)